MALVCDHVGCARACCSLAELGERVRAREAESAELAAQLAAAEAERDAAVSATAAAAAEAAHADRMNQLLEVRAHPMPPLLEIACAWPVCQLQQLLSPS